MWLVPVSLTKRLFRCSNGSDFITKLTQPNLTQPNQTAIATFK